MHDIIDTTDMNPDKEAARDQFNRVTKALNIKHTFSFDEVWEVQMQNRYRNNVMKLEDKLKEVGSSQKQIARDNPLKHMFADGLYIREVYNPKDELIVTKIHKVDHPFFLMRGDMSILTENGSVRIRAPYYGITKAGTKRVIKTHEACVFVTVHATKETDIDKIEEEVIASSYDELPTKLGGIKCHS